MFKPGTGVSNALEPVPVNTLLLYSKGSPVNPVDIFAGVVGSGSALENVEEL